MIVTILREELKSAISIAERFVGKQLSLPIASNVLLKTEGQKLKLRATNLEIGIEITLPAKVTKEGSIAIPPRILSSVLQTLNDLKVTLQEEGGALLIETDASQSEIRGISGKDFPIMPGVATKSSLKITNQLLIPQLTRVLPTVSPSEFKPEISGVLFKTSKKEVFLVGTDTFRLAEAKIPGFEAEGETLAIIPLRPLQEFARIADLGEETIFTFGEGQVSIQTGEVVIISRLLGGRYPEYQALVPTQFSTTLRIPRNELLASARLSSAFGSKLHDVILSYRPNHLTAEIVSPEVGKHTKEISAHVSGKSGRVGFNYRYLSDALEALNSEETTLSLIDETRPALLQDDTDPSFFTILMPIRIS